MEQCRNARAGVTGDPQENPLTSDIIQHGVAPTGIEPRSPCGFTTVLSGKSSIVNLKGKASSILHDKWYLDKKNTEEEKNIRIVEAAADIIRRYIRSLVFDTIIYPAMEYLDSRQLPELLKIFLNRVIQGEVVERKNTAIGEAIMSTCRPRSYISPTLEECKLHNQGSCIVTFDQPLYAKASEIIAAAPPGELDSITLRLDGFHLLVSFMGSIGLIMSGSGIEELGCKFMLKSSVTHIISGHAFSIAVRAHVFTSQTLITMILRMENLFGVYQEKLHKLFLGV
ncbi:hypothetical protein PR048_023445 [Dryococelus australis]|uniref:Uncharacterized protein n=1 Tax=Dryococelus australis TaxID=614101 RepID=A0ABQ9GU52_9NEOP|nr:hypothetical protein PR048_023445 [Dryococelus australis]